MKKGPRRDFRSFPTRAGDLQGRCQALMHSLTIDILTDLSNKFLLIPVSYSSSVNAQTVFFNMGNIVKHRLQVCLAGHLRLARPAREVAVDAAEDWGVPGVGLQTHLDRAAVSDC